MNDLVRCLAGFAVFAVSVTAEGQSAFVYRASNLMDAQLSIHAPSAKYPKGSVTFSNDETASADICAADSEYVCAFSWRIVFAAPKDPKRARGRWTVNGVTFERLRSDVSVSLLGKTIDGLWLVSTVGNAKIAGRDVKDREPNQALYSPEHGLIGFSDGPSITYWSESVKGFGARP